MRSLLIGWLEPPQFFSPRLAGAADFVIRGVLLNVPVLLAWLAEAAQLWLPCVLAWQAEAAQCVFPLRVGLPG